MQAAARTPTSILRRRLDKENEEGVAKAAKRHKLANRRVSFAPDDELETKHIFKNDGQSSADMAMASPTEVLGMGVSSMLHPGDAQLQQFPPAIMPSPDGLSPLSMDLTNNSYEQGRAAGSTAVPGLPSNAPPQHNDNFQPHIPQLRHAQHAEYTRNITMNVPNLSTLVEEDEEEYAGGDATSGGNSQVFESPHPSPFVMREMQQRGGNSLARDRSPMWGYAPGVDDTLEVKVGVGEGIGEATFNNVFHTSTTGDVTRAIRDGVTGGHPFAHRGQTRTLGRRSGVAAELPPAALDGAEADLPAAGPGPSTAAAAAAAAYLAPLPAANQPEHNHHHARLIQQLPPALEALRPTANLGPAQPPPQPRGPVLPAPGFLDNTARLLDETQTDIWRLPAPDADGADDRRRLSVASNKVGGLGYRRGHMGGGAGGGAGAGETTMLLGPTITQQLGMDVTAAPTLQLLADTTTQSAYERVLGKAPGQTAVPSVAPPPRHGNRSGRGYGAAVSTNAAEHQHVALQDSVDMSIELHQVGRPSAANATDLLGDAGGLSLDAFAMPPEPTINLMGGAPFGKAADVGAAAAAAAATASARPAVPKISCQEFLSLVDVSFNEKVCRMSFLPQSDPPPKTIEDIFEAATVTSCHMTVRQGNMIEVSSRLASMQSHVQELEDELTARNLELFTEVQLASPSRLETIKEQAIMLKKLCRIRTVRSIKQTELAALDDLLGQLEQGRARLVEEVAATTADMERLNLCAQEKEAFTAAMARRVQEDEQQSQEALQRKKGCEALYQRLQALRAQNQERERRIEEAREQHRAAEQERVPREQLKEELKQLEGRIAALTARSTSTALTPGREGQITRQVAAKREEIEAILGLHALTINMSTADRNRTFSFVFRDAFDILVDASGSAYRITVSQRASAAAFKGLHTSVVSTIGTSAAALSCIFPPTQLQLRLELVIQHLFQLCCVAEHLDACHLEYHNMVQPKVTHDTAQRGSDAGPALLLGFINTRTTTKVAISMSWQAALKSDVVAPELEVQIRNLETPETQRQTREALQTTVLNRLEPGVRYFPALCYAMSVTVG